MSLLYVDGWKQCICLKLHLQNSYVKVFWILSEMTHTRWSKKQTRPVNLQLFIVHKNEQHGARRQSSFQNRLTVLRVILFLCVIAVLFRGEIVPIYVSQGFTNTLLKKMILIGTRASYPTSPKTKQKSTKIACIVISFKQISSCRKRVCY